MQEAIPAYNGLITERGLRLMSRWGWSILGLWAIALITWAILWPEPYRKGWWLVLELIFVGRTVCAYEGVRLGFSNWYIFVQGGLQDIGMFLVVFPYFARFYAHVARVRYIDRILRKLAEMAERHRDRLQGMGLVGLFLFVFFPVSGTGTLVGCVVGYMLGLHLRGVVPVVIAGHVSCLIILLGFFDQLEPALRALDEGFAQYFAWIFLATMLLCGWLYGTLKKRFSRSEEAVEPVPVGMEAEAAASE